MVDFKSALMIAALAQAILLGAILLSYAKSRVDPRFWLGLFVTCYGLASFGDLAIDTGLLAAFPPVFVIPATSQFLLGPLFYVYLGLLTGRNADQGLSRYHKHAVLPLVAAGIQIVILVIPVPDITAILVGDFDATTVPELAVLLLLLCLVLLTVIVTAAYIIAGFLRLHRYASEIRDEFSNLETRRLRWLRASLATLLLIWLAFISADAAGWTENQSIASVMLLAELAALYFFAVSGLRQKVIFSAPEQSGAIEAAPFMPGDAADEGSGKYTKSALSESDMERIAAKIIKAIESDALYSNSQLSLSMLASHIGVQPAYISQTLSQNIQAKFYDYVARTRVQAAQRHIVELGPGETVLDVALRVGFNSKSTFNAAFKRETGLTPTKWRQKMKSSHLEDQP